MVQCKVGLKKFPKTGFSSAAGAAVFFAAGASFDAGDAFFFAAGTCFSELFSVNRLFFSELFSVSGFSQLFSVTRFGFGKAREIAPTVAHKGFTAAATALSDTYKLLRPARVSELSIDISGDWPENPPR